MSDHSDRYRCKICNKNYANNSSLWNHNNKFHNKTNNFSTTSNNLLSPNIKQQKVFRCQYCGKIYNIQQSRWKHEQKCKKKDLIVLDNKIIPDPNQQNHQITNINNQQNNNTNNINNQLIDLIVEKQKIIEELKSKSDENTVIIPKKIQSTLSINNVDIISRMEDNYINATQLCQAGNKQFNDWFRLNSTKQLINEAESETGIPVSQLIDIKKGNTNKYNQGTWIHPDLAIQLAQWISSKFALQVSKWIRTLFTDGNVSIEIKLLEEKNKELQLKDEKIKLLEDTYNKKQKRTDYPCKNVIYLVTSKDNKNKRIYIIGKAKNLKNRLSGYNKTAEHEVVYYKECGNVINMNIIEKMVLVKLQKYQEKANRDRFILPIEKDISFFTKLIDSSVKFILNNEIIL